ncbi:unnamed protein product [Schistocephalus solidus]|uniref:CACTA en-spm transposon protein n=1 Tax=Schistocephalus solidus TaxID=70667 RepID=A0A183TBZ0_SCHSO|nr:unnamed protein product [Schistocephalus solidus]
MGVCVLRNCAEHRLLMTKTFFHLPTRRWQLLDYVLVQRRDRQDVLVTKVIRDSDGWTEHSLVISKMRLQLKPGRRPQVIQSTTLDVHGRARRHHKDWIEDHDADISNRLAEKNQLHKAYMDLQTNATIAAFFKCHRLVQQRLREMQDIWMVRKAEKIQEYADHNEMKNQTVEAQ